MIEVQNLCFSYGQHAVLEDINFSVKKGQLLFVIGPNGVGKSTLFRCMLGLLTSYGGSITVDGKDIRKLSAKELAYRIAYIPQFYGHAFHFTVLDMVLMGTTHRVSLISAPGRHETRIALESLERVGIVNLAEKYFTHLSGGEQQLVLIARALAQQSKILLMDEPTSGLDYGRQSNFLAQVQSLARDGYTIMLSTHNPQHAALYADLILAISDGHLAAFGSPAQVMNETLLQKLYRLSVRFIETGDGGKLIVPLQNGANTAYVEI